MFVCNTHQHVYAEMQPKKNGEYVHLLSWALHEIKRINPCNMHDEFHEYVEGKKRAYGNPLQDLQGFIR